MSYERPENGTMEIKKYESVYGGLGFLVLTPFVILVAIAFGLIIGGHV